MKVISIKLIKHVTQFLYPNQIPVVSVFSAYRVSMQRKRCTGTDNLLSRTCILPGCFSLSLLLSETETIKLNEEDWAGHIKVKINSSVVQQMNLWIGKKWFRILVTYLISNWPKHVKHLNYFQFLLKSNAMHLKM